MVIWMPIGVQNKLPIMPPFELSRIASVPLTNTSMNEKCEYQHGEIPACHILALRAFCQGPHSVQELHRLLIPQHSRIEALGQ